MTYFIFKWVCNRSATLHAHVSVRMYKTVIVPPMTYKRCLS